MRQRSNCEIGSEWGASLSASNTALMTRESQLVEPIFHAGFEQEGEASFGRSQNLGFIDLIFSRSNLLWQVKSRRGESTNDDDADDGWDSQNIIEFHIVAQGLVESMIEGRDKKIDDVVSKLQRWTQF